MKNYNQLINEAKIFYKSNQFENTKNCLLKVIKNFKLEDKIKLNIFLLLADVLNKLNNFKDVEKYLFKYLEIDPINFGVLNLIAKNYTKMREFHKSEEYYMKAININKNNEALIINLAILLENLGRDLDALNFYKKALAINPKNLGVLYNMSKLKEKNLDKKEIDLINELIKSDSPEYFNIASGYFLLANEEGKKNNFSKEASFLEKANDFSFKSREKINKSSLKYWLNIIPKKLDKLIYITNSDNQKKNKNINPIFIIGLPRSGSTLMEMIISSGDNKIEDLGETNLINWALLNNHKNDLIHNPNDNKEIKINIDSISKEILNSYENLNVSIKEKKVLLLDKSLENFFYIDLILKIFPNAKFIHTYRNLEDNIFAIYKEFLNKISWTHSLDDIILYVDNYLKIIKKQTKKNKDNILSISLEELTNDPNKISKIIYQFCNLDWDEKCLNFQSKSSLFSNTASNNQIRSGIKSYNKKKYEPYHFLIENYKKNFDWLQS